MKRTLVVFLITTLLATTSAPIASADSGYNPAMDIKKDPLLSVTNAGSVFDVAQSEGSGLPLGALNVDPLTGAANYNYPLMLAPGRKGLTPTLSLSYNSQNKNNFGSVGYGWDLPLAFIQRSNRLGVNHLYDGTNEFQISLFGEGGELAPVSLTDSTHGTYGKKIEDTFHTYEFQTNNTWVVTDQNGWEYTFGASAATRQFDVNDPTHIYKWMIEEIRDPDDNYIRFEYFKEGNQIYVNNIYYTGHGPSTPANDGPYNVTFNYQTRPDSMVSYQSGFRVESNKRLINFTLVVASSVAEHIWELAYTTGDNNSRSLLQEITMIATNADGDTVTMNPTTFEYTSSHPDGVMDWELLGGPPPANDWVPLEFVASAGGDIGAGEGDVNGDGYADIFSTLIPDTAYSSDPCDTTACVYMEDPKVYLNNTNFPAYPWTEEPTWTLPTSFMDSQTMALDINGDALPDLYRPDYPTDNGFTEGHSINTGTNWLETMISLDGVYEDDLGFRFADFNGDGWVDKAKNQAAAYDIPGGNIYFNNGGMDWENQPAWSLPGATTISNIYVPVAPLDGGLRFADVNMDGLTDIIQALSYDGYDNNIIPEVTIKKVYLNNGQDGWVWEPGFIYNSPIFLELYFNSAWWYGDVNSNICLYDLNADGLLDVGHSGNAANFNNGTNGWDPEIIPRTNQPKCGANAGPNSYSAYRTLDLNGDGIVDQLDTGSNRNDKIRISQEEIPDLLSQINNAAGGTTDVTYTVSTQYKDASNNLLNPDLSLPLSTVSQVVEDNGLGDIVTKTYTYADGRYYRYDSFRSEFAGFGTSTETIGDRVVTTTFDLGCEAGDTCSHPLYLPQTLLKTDADPTIWVVDGNTRRGFTSWSAFVNSGFLQRKVQMVDASIINALPMGASWASEFDDFMYEVDLANYAKKGKILAQEVSDGGGNLFQKQTYTWEVTDLGNGRFFPKMTTELQFDYDGNATHRDRATTYIYDAATGRVTSKLEKGEVIANPSTNAITNLVAGDERTTNTTYWTSNAMVKPNVTTILDDNGNQVASTDLNYNANGNVVENKNWLNTTGGWLTSSSTYNAYGLPLTQTNPRNFTTTITYDSDSLFPATVTNPLSQTTTFTYDYLSGKVATQTDPNGGVQATVYDGLGRPLTQSVPHPATGMATPLTVTTYSNTAVPVYALSTTTVNSVASVSRSYFDGFGRVVQAWLPAEGSGHTQLDVWYDELGQVIQQTLPYSASNIAWIGRIPGNPSTTSTYDSLGRPLVQTNPVGTTSHAYDQWETTVTDANGHIKEYERDAYGNLVQVNEHNGSAVYDTHYGYDALNRLTQRTDDHNNIQNFTYDSLGRKLTHQNLHAPSTSNYGTWTYTYDANANRLTQIAPSGQVMGWDYDALDRITAQDENNDNINEVTYAYDNAAVNGRGRLTGVSAPNLTVALAYDEQGNVSQETKTIGGTPYLTSTIHDLLGRPTDILYPDSVMSVASTYNAMSALETLIKDGTETIVADFDYSPAGQISFMEFGNGVTTTNTYDPNENFRLTSKTTVGIFDNDPDSDGDGVPNSLDLCASTEPLDANDVVDANGCALSQLDTDSDMLNDYQEIYVYATNPALADTDGDGLNDGDEVNVYLTDPLDSDTDEDGLTDGDEVSIYTTNPALYDTDSNGLPDSITASALTLDPYDPNPTEDLTLTWTGNANLTLIDPALVTVGLTGVEYRVSGDASIPWTTATPADGAFDSLNEDYTVTIGPLTAPGTYTLSVRLVSFVGAATLYTNQTADTVNIFAEEEIEEASEPFMDSDGDLLSDDMEADLGTNPLLWDTDGNGLPDSISGVANTLDPYTPDPTTETLLSYTGFASLTFPFFGFPPSDLYISDVEFIVDQATNPAAVWQSATPTDGPAFDVSTEPYAFITPALAPGPHEVATRVEITVGSVTFTYGEDADDVTVLNSSMMPLTSNETATPEDTTDATDSSEPMPPFQPVRDSDSDGLSDDEEEKLGTDPFDPDTDHDGITDKDEVDHGSDPLNPDTDGDGVNDGEEVKQGTNPLLPDQNPEIDRNDVPPPTDDAAPKDDDKPRRAKALRTDAPRTATLRRAAFRPLRWLASLLFGHTELALATPASGNIQHLSYTYDGAGNLTQIADTSITPTAKTMNYLYDDLNRLESALSSGYASGDFGQGYSYDSIGNMTYKGGLGAMNYFGTGNPTPHAPTSVAGMPYNYSANGNLISDGVNTYTWTIKNELSSVITPSGTWTYTYDPGGTLLTSTDPDGDTTTYISPLMEVRPDGPVYYIYGAGQRLAKVTGDLTIAGGDLTTLHPDHLGSTALTTDESGMVSELLDYYPYGEELAASATYSDAPETAYTYGGKEHTEDTGLSYFEARHYKPEIGKFISMDPFPRRAPEYMLPDPQSWNSYAYARNNPMAYTDPSGELQVHTDGATQEQIDEFNTSLDQLQQDVANNPDLQEYYRSLYGVDVLETLTNDEVGPDVYIAKENDNEDLFGRYHRWKNNIDLYENVYNKNDDDGSIIKHTLIHELEHWANDVASFFGDLNPDTSAFGQIDEYYYGGGGNAKDYRDKFTHGVWGYGSQIILYGTTHLN